MTTDTLTLNSRTGDVEASEIERIMRGDDLIRVSNEDIQELFDIDGLRRKIALTLTPVLHSTKLMQNMILGIALITSAIIYFMMVPMNGAVIAQTIVGAIACISGVFAIGSLMDSNLKPVKLLVQVVGGLALCGLTAYTAFSLLPSSELNGVHLLKEVLKVSGLAVLGMFAFMSFHSLYKECFKFAEAAVRMKSNSHTILRDDTSVHDRYKYDSISAEDFAKKYDIPESIKYSLNNHIETGKYNQMIFCKPELDLNKYDANETMKRKVARDPAVLLSDGKQMYLVGAWDIAEDHQAIMAQASVSNEEKIQETRDLADRLGKKAKQELLGALKSKANRLQAQGN